METTGSADTMRKPSQGTQKRRSHKRILLLAVSGVIVGAAWAADIPVKTAAVVAADAMARALPSGADFSEWIKHFEARSVDLRAAIWHEELPRSELEARSGHDDGELSVKTRNELQRPVSLGAGSDGAPALSSASPKLLRRTGPRNSEKQSIPDTLTKRVWNPDAAGVKALASEARPFNIGDRVKLIVYEHVATEEDRWGRANTALKGLEQRPELSGEYTVQEDGTIALPLLGRIDLVKQTSSQAQAAVARAFEDLTSHKATANIVPLEKAPVYVLGAKNPGAYKFSPGMTVLHAVALAGGLDRGPADAWQKTEAIRESQKRRAALVTLSKLLARLAVLKSERDGTFNEPLRLTELVGEVRAKVLIDEQRDRRKSILEARGSRSRAQRLQALGANQEVDLMSQRLEGLDELISLRKQRTDAMRHLVNSKTLNSSVLNQVLSELSEAEQRRQESAHLLSSAKQRVAVLAAEASSTTLANQSELDHEIQSNESQIAESERELATSEGLLTSLKLNPAQSDESSPRVQFKVLRQTQDGPLEMPSNGIALLKPGDLVNVEMVEAEAGWRDAPGMQHRPEHGTTATRASQQRAVARQ